VATICDGRRHTFVQFHDRVVRLAGALQDLEKGDRVGILSLNSDRYVEYDMAVPWASLHDAVPEVAAALGVADTTVRTHVGRLFEKTGVRRQADLVKLVTGICDAARRLSSE
jgi:acyl-CoA synthetase (AMP-forming)/AMP-acid ligase II